MKALFTLGTALVLVTGAHAGDVYLRSEVAYLMPTDSTADNGVGGFVALGYAFGETAQNELELEIGTTSWDLRDSVNEGGLLVRGKVDYEMIPIMLNYRFHAPLAATLTGYLQVGIGAALVDTDWELRWDQNGWLDDTATESAVAASVGAGIAWKLGENLTLNVGYRYIAVNTFDFELLDDLTISSIESNVHALEAGLKFRF